MDQKKALGFLGYWVATTIGILVGSWIFKGNIVLGNDKLTAGHSAIFLGLVITVLGALVPIVLAKLGVKTGSNSSSKVDVFGVKMSGENYLGLIYFAANFVFIWVLKRFALQLGMGVSNVFYVVVLAILITLGQWVVVKTTKK